MPQFTRRSVVVSVGLIGATTLVLSACSSGGVSEPTQTSSPIQTETSASPKPSTTGFPVTFDATLASVYSRLDDVGQKGAQTYGLNILEGYTKINDSSVRVRMLGTVNYKDDGGHIGGFMTLQWSNVMTIGLSQDGTATMDQATKKTTFEAKLTVINGSGDAIGTTGTGNWTGKRKSTLGSPISINVALDLSNAPQVVTGDSRSRGSQTPSASYAATIEP